MTEPARTIAAFDFDGTITRSDTLIPFLRRSVGTANTARVLLALSLRITRSMAGIGSRDAAKEQLLYRLLAGQPAARLEEEAEAFAEHVVAGRLREEALERIAFHRAAGHELVVVSASPELYVEPVARRLGFAAALGTRLEVGPDGRLTGRLAGPNCRGPEKVRRLREWIGDETPAIVAYGDSGGDRELLAFAGDGAVWMTRPKGAGRSRRSPRRR